MNKISKKHLFVSCCISSFVISSANAAFIENPNPVLTTMILVAAMHFFIYLSISLFRESTSLDDIKELYKRGYYIDVVKTLTPHFIIWLFVLLSTIMIYKRR